jgi:hypothetical protein
LGRSPRLALLPIGAGTSIAIQYGTFRIAGDALDTARNKPIAGARHDSFLVLNNGPFADIPY